MREHDECNERPAAQGESISQVLHELGNDFHRKVLACVACAPERVGLIAEDLRVASHRVSKSLSQLKAYELVEFRCQKNDRIYRVNESRTVSSDGRVLSVTFEMPNGDAVVVRKQCTRTKESGDDPASPKRRPAPRSPLMGAPPGRMDEGRVRQEIEEDARERAERLRRSRSGTTTRGARCPP